jgi:hypothetical protein
MSPVYQMEASDQRVQWCCWKEFLSMATYIRETTALDLLLLVAQIRKGMPLKPPKRRIALLLTDSRAVVRPQGATAAF